MESNWKVPLGWLLTNLLNYVILCEQAVGGNNNTLIIVLSVAGMNLLYLVGLFSFLEIETIKGVYTMTGKKKAGNSNVKEFGNMTFILVPINDERKDLVRTALASGIAHFSNCEDALLSILPYGKVSIKDDTDNHCYLVSITHNHPERKSLKDCVTSYRHKNLITALVLHYLDAEEGWSEKQREEKKRHDDTDW